VQISQAVGQTRTEVKQGTSRLPAHPGVAIRRTGNDSFEQGKDRTQSRESIECGDNVHLGSAWIREADIHSTNKQRFN
jgi:hypothetical protein